MRNKTGIILVSILAIVAITVIVIGQHNFTNTQFAISSVDVNEPEEEQTISPDKIYVYGLNENIDIYVKGSNEESQNYIGYHVRHLEKSIDTSEISSNYDVWKINGASEYLRNKSNDFRLVQKVVRSGEWEMALYERGATDFVGGSAHGDEITTSVEAFIDGKKVALDEFIDTEADEFVLSTVSDVYRDNTITAELELIAEHHKTYTFNKDGLQLEQEVIFKEDLLWFRPYLSMLPILRTNDGGQVTDTYEVNDETFDVSEEGFGEQRFEAEKASIWSEESGITATVEITDKSLDIPSIFHIYDSPNYNKMYFAYTYDDFQVSSGDSWKQTTQYVIDTSN